MKRTPLPTALIDPTLAKFRPCKALTILEINLLGMEVFEETFMDLMFLNYDGLSLSVLLMWQVPFCLFKFLRVILTRCMEPEEPVDLITII